MSVSAVAAIAARVYWMNTPFSGVDRPRQSRLEFGGPDSYRLKLRRIGVKYFEVPPEEPCFGMYLGPHDDVFVVGVQHALCGKNQFVGMETFESIGALQQIWELD